MSATQKLLRFGVFELNLDSEELSKSGTLVKLPPQPLKLLALLASHAGQVVARDEIQRQLWVEETFVGFEHGVNKCVNQIRTVLGDNPDHPLYIETVPRRGYRFRRARSLEDHSRAATQGGRVRLRRTEPAAGFDRRSASTRRQALTELWRQPIRRLMPDAGPAAGRRLRSHPLSKSGLGSRELVWPGSAAAVLLVAAIGGGLYWRWRAHKAPALTEKDTIVLADFDNKTGDPVFDDTLKQGLAIQLEQSPFLDLISQGKVNRTLKMMGRSAGDHVTPEVAREVCQRTNSKAMVSGSIAELGSQYVIGLKAVDCDYGRRAGGGAGAGGGQGNGAQGSGRCGDQLAQQAGRVAQLGAEIRHSVGGSDHAIAGGAESLQPGTRRRLLRKGYTPALPFFKRAVELDPNFAMAYAAMAAIYSNLNEAGLCGGECTQGVRAAGEGERTGAVAHRGNLLLDCDGRTGEGGTGVRTVAADLPEGRLAVRRPAAFVYTSLGNWEKALEEAREAMRLEPNDGGQLCQPRRRPT